MKKYFIIIVVFGLLFSSCSNSNNEPSNVNGELKGNLSISGAFALYPLAVKWGEEFKKENPGVNLDISAGGAGKGMTDVLSGMVDIGMVSRDISQEEMEKGAFGISVTIDAVVPTINSNNPLIGDINSKGLTKEAFQKIFIGNNIKTWGEVLNNNSKESIKIYTRSDAAGAPEVWAKYLGKKQEDLTGVGVFGDPGIANAVKSDKNGIGYNNIAFAYDVSTRKPISGLTVAPIDINENGMIDKEEDFYSNLDSLVKAIAGGKYPSPPARALYFVTKGKTDNIVVKEFIKWILTKGQAYVLPSGYIKLQDTEIESNLNKIK